MRTLLPLLSLLACGGQTSEDSDGGPIFDPNPPEELGGEREAEVILPADYDIGQTYPLVVMLHGYGANSLVQDVIFGLGARIDSRQFILVKPDGTVDGGGNQFWNAFTECCDFYGTEVDDVAYISGLIEEARTLYPISHVALVGHSNGGFMSYRMACERPDLIDRIAPLAGTLGAQPACTSTEPVRVLHIHGTRDDSVNYESAGSHNGARASISHFTDLAGCTGPTAASTRDYLSGVDGEEHTIETWDCPGGDMQLWTGLEADHVYFSGNDAFKDDLADWLTAP